MKAQTQEHDSDFQDCVDSFDFNNNSVDYDDFHNCFDFFDSDFQNCLDFFDFENFHDCSEFVNSDIFHNCLAPDDFHDCLEFVDSDSFNICFDFFVRLIEKFKKTVGQKAASSSPQ